MGVTRRPSVSIRRHRFAQVELADLVDNDTLTDQAAHFLRVLVRARMNVMIAGATCVWMFGSPDRVSAALEN
jgi:Flp pilus assembly CpaF family ATPase